MTTTTLSKVCILSALSTFPLLLAPAASAQSHLSLALHNLSGPTGDFRVHVGDTVSFHAVVGNLDDFGDSITVKSVLVVVHYGSGDVNLPNLAGNGVLIPSFGEAAEFFTNFVVQPEDGEFLWVDSAIRWTDNRDGAGGSPQTASAFYTDMLQVLKPTVQIFQQSRALPDVPSIAFDGMVTNTGNTPLHNVVVVSDNGTPQNTSDDTTTSIPTLNPGCAAPFNGTYPAAGASSNTVTVRATDDLGLTITSSNACAIPVPLSIARSGTGAIQLSWPGWAEGFQLESSGGIGETWKVVNSHPVLRNGGFVITLPMTTNQLYRLVRL